MVVPCIIGGRVGGELGMVKIAMKESLVSKLDEIELYLMRRLERLLVTSVRNDKDECDNIVER